MAGSYFIAKLFRQHRSAVIAVPKPVCIALGLGPGDHALFVWDQAEGKFEFKKFDQIGEKHGGNGGLADKPDQSGRTQEALSR